MITAARYREYDKLRRPTTKKPESQQHINPAKPHHATPKKAAPAATPQKANSQFLIPNIALLQEEEAELEPTPAAVRMHLGPTPQKDGQILSLFDDLSSTASKPSRTALASIEANANFTPSKPSQLLFAENESPPENVHDRTPASSSKRFLLDSFVSTTPLKRKREDEEPIHATPSSAKGLSTPAFLRRTSNMLIMDTLVEEAQNDHEIKSLNIGRMRQPPFKKRGIVRSLSSIIQGLRKQEDDKLDEELEMMREKEDADDDHDSAKPTVQVADSQVVMPLGPDQGIESEESEEEERDTGVFRKPWKKKGSKRQTKRVISKSSLRKRDTLHCTNYCQCDLHQRPKLQPKLISLIRLLTTRRTLPKHNSLVTWRMSTRIRMQAQHTATPRQSANDNSPRLPRQTKMTLQRAPRAMVSSRRQQRRSAPLPTPTSEGSTSRTRTQRRTAEAGLEESDDFVPVSIGVMHCWSFYAYEALIGKNTRVWFMERWGSMEWDYTQQRLRTSSIALILKITVSKASEQKESTSKENCQMYVPVHHSIHRTPFFLLSFRFVPSSPPAQKRFRDYQNYRRTWPLTP
jgi:hypothetical protein